MFEIIKKHYAEPNPLAIYEFVLETQATIETPIIGTEHVT